MHKLFKTLLKFVVVPFITIAAVAAVGIYLMLRMPAPATVCANVHGLVDAEFASRGIEASPAAKKEILGARMGESVEECTDKLAYSLRVTSRPMMKVASEMRCLAAAGSLDAMDSCSP